MHVHVSEIQSGKHEECVGRHGMTPLQVLDQYGVFDPRRSGGPLRLVQSGGLRADGPAGRHSRPIRCVNQPGTGLRREPTQCPPCRRRNNLSAGHGRHVVQQQP